jgi:SAM-dependent methyltransferase
MEPEKITTLQTSYDRVARHYVEEIFSELKDKPLDRALLDRLADSVRGLGPICDMGCGPGHVARYLADRGVEVFGIDLSPAMVEHALQLNPGINFRQGNMLTLEDEPESCGGIAAFYSIIHIPREEMADALRELKRVLRPGGVLLLAFHLGRETIHRDEWWGEEVSIDFRLFEADEMTNYLKTAGFEIEETIERDPYPEVEYQSRRAYILRRSPML